MKDEIAKHEIDKIKEYEQKGYKSSYQMIDGKFTELESESTFEAEEIMIIDEYRYEGQSNPEDMSMLYVIEVANKSKVKVNIIQGIDRKIPLSDIASSNNLSMEELLHEMDMIVASGTKVDINYYIDDNVDEYSREDILEYFMEADTDSTEEAFLELKDEDVTIEEIQLMRIKFMSDMAN